MMEDDLGEKMQFYFVVFEVFSCIFYFIIENIMAPLDPSSM
jgi:hypothetical protein